MISLNLNKKNISKIISNKKGYSLSFSHKIIDNLIEILKSEIKNDYLILKNIGSFKLIQKKLRLGRNPKTKKIFEILPRQSVSFTPSKSLIKKINY